MISLRGRLSGVLKVQVHFPGLDVCRLLEFGVFTRIIAFKKIYRVAILLPFFESLACWFNNTILGVIELGEFNPAKLVHYDPPVLLCQGQFPSILWFIYH